MGFEYKKKKKGEVKERRRKGKWERDVEGLVRKGEVS